MAPPFDWLWERRSPWRKRKWQRGRPWGERGHSWRQNMFEKPRKRKHRRYLYRLCVCSGATNSKQGIASPALLIWCNEYNDIHEGPIWWMPWCDWSLIEYLRWPILVDWPPCNRISQINDHHGRGWACCHLEENSRYYEIILRSDPNKW